MKKAPLTLVEQKKEEERTISEFLHFFEDKKDFTRVVYETWTAKDVLGHVASWHMSFARNLLDAMNQIKPTPFKGSLTEVNEREVQTMAQFSVAELVEKIRTAQEQISRNIENPTIKGIAYKKGSRDYSPIEHLEVVRRHVGSHLKDLQNKY